MGNLQAQCPAQTNTYFGCDVLGSGIYYKLLCIKPNFFYCPVMRRLFTDSKTLTFHFNKPHQ